METQFWDFQNLETVNQGEFSNMEYWCHFVLVLCNFISINLSLYQIVPTSEILTITKQSTPLTHKNIFPKIPFPSFSFTLPHGTPSFCFEHSPYIQLKTELQPNNPHIRLLRKPLKTAVKCHFFPTFQVYVRRQFYIHIQHPPYCPNFYRKIN